MSVGLTMAAFTGKIKVPLPAFPTDYERNTANLETAEFVTANCACTRNALELVNGFDEDFKMAWREDSDLQFRLIEAGVPVLKTNAMVTHPVRSAEWGASIREQKKSMFNALLYKKHPQLYKQKITGTGLWNYYLIIIAFLTAITALVQKQYTLFNIALLLWMGATFYFLLKRLKNTSRQPGHLFEMFITSLLIPFISVYWNWYGALKFKKLPL